MTEFWKNRTDPLLSDKGLYIIGNKSLAEKNLYKVGYSGVILRNRLGQINEILSPSSQEPLLIYGLVVPKKGKSGKPANARSKEINQLEKEIHTLYRQRGLLEVFPGSHRYSEWVREENLDKLFKRIEKLFDDHEMDYNRNFDIHDWRE